MAPRKTWLFFALGIVLLLISALVLKFVPSRRNYPHHDLFPSPQGEAPGVGRPSPVLSPHGEGNYSLDKGKGQEESGDIKQRFDLLLEKSNDKSRTLNLPPVPKKAAAPPAQPVPSASDAGAPGRQKRKTLPMGLILWDNVKVMKNSADQTVLYRMQTGDIVRVYPDSDNSPRAHIHPGVDVFLAATTQNMEAAGKQYPDQDGWIEKNSLQVFKPDQAIDFTQTTEPMTLSDDPNFSMLSFYERAMKNPDPAVHRIIGPRLLEIVSLHEDYVSSWKSLYRDPDPKIRAYTLSQLKARGVGRSRKIVEDLILRLTELTQTRATDETEIEVLTVIEILKDSHSPRVAAAFDSFREAWAGKQSAKILECLTIQ